MLTNIHFFFSSECNKLLFISLWKSLLMSHHKTRKNLNERCQLFFLVCFVPLEGQWTSFFHILPLLLKNKLYVFEGTEIICVSHTYLSSGKTAFKKHMSSPRHKVVFSFLHHCQIILCKRGIFFLWLFFFFFFENSWVRILGWVIVFG